MNDHPNEALQEELTNLAPTTTMGISFDYNIATVIIESMDCLVGSFGNRQQETDMNDFLPPGTFPEPFNT